MAFAQRPGSVGSWNSPHTLDNHTKHSSSDARAQANNTCKGMLHAWQANTQTCKHALIEECTRACFFACVRRRMHACSVRIKNHHKNLEVAARKISPIWSCLFRAPIFTDMHLSDSPTRLLQFWLQAILPHTKLRVCRGDWTKKLLQLHATERRQECL